MVDFVGKELFNHNGVTKSMFITYDNGVLTNDDIHYESFSLTESLCSEQRLTFGCCEASEVKFKCSNVVGSLKGQEITIDLSINDGQMADPRTSGIYTFKISSDVRTKVYYHLNYWQYLISGGAGTYVINTRFDEISNNSQDADIYIAIDGMNVPLVNHYAGFPSSTNVKSYMLNTYTTYIVTLVYTQVGSVKGYYFSLDDKLSENKLRIGTFYVDSVKKINEKRFLEVTAYDAMYKILNADVTDWYDTLDSSFTLGITVKEMRIRFFTYLGITQDDVTLANDSVVLTIKAIDTTDGKTVVKGSDIIVPICEINGVFGHIGRDNVFHYVSLQAGDYTLYPANNVYPADNLYPDSRFANVECDDVAYISASYEDYYTVPIDGVAVVDTKRDLVGRFYHTNPQNFYIVEDNFVVLSTNDSLSDIAQNLLLAIYKVSYRPHETKAIGNPCYEVGDAIRYQTKYATIESYMLQRTLTGIQAMRDVIIADGEEYY